MRSRRKGWRKREEAGLKRRVSLLRLRNQRARSCGQILRLFNDFVNNPMDEWIQVSSSQTGTFASHVERLEG